MQIEVKMSLILRVSPRMPHPEIVARFRACRDGSEKLRWQAVMLKGEGWSAADLGQICKRKEDWVRRTVRRFNEEGPEGLLDGRATNGRERMLSAEEETDLWEALQGTPPDGGIWTSPKVAAWIAERVGRPVDELTGWRYLRRLGFTPQRPRPKHPGADEKAQAAFKKGGFKVSWTTSFEPTPEPRSRSGRRTKPGSG